MANERLARAIIPKSGCTSLLGPDRFIAFSHAAIFWASLYHVLFAEDSTAVKSSVLRAKAQSLSDIYGVQLNYFGRDLENPNGYNFQQIEPRDESTA